MEFVGVDKAARSKTGVWKMQEWTIWQHVAGLDKAGNRHIGTVWQGWTLDNVGEKAYPSKLNVTVKQYNCVCQNIVLTETVLY